MKWFVQYRVLHGVYSMTKDIPDDLHRMADAYEGYIPSRKGWNMPLPIVSTTPTFTIPSFLRPFYQQADYLVVYPNNDPQTKKHELLHAKYAMDPIYRADIHKLWNNLTAKQQTRVRTTLLSLHYPDNPEILLDEFQAYYYTEKPRFFGIHNQPIKSIQSNNRFTKKL